MKLSEITPNPGNPRTIKDARFKKLCNSIRDFPKMMALRPIVIDRENGNLILGGNMRFRALEKLGFKEIPDEWVKSADDFTEDEKKRFIVEDNMGFGSWDMDILANSFDASDLMEWGFDENELGVFSAEDIDIPQLKDGDRAPFQQMTFTLHDEQAKEIKAAISKAMSEGGGKSTVNENGNGNALAFIAERFNRG
jgi:hypothetical protein